MGSGPPDVIRRVRKSSARADQFNPRALRELTPCSDSKASTLPSGRFVQINCPKCSRGCIIHKGDRLITEVTRLHSAKLLCFPVMAGCEHCHGGDTQCPVCYPNQRPCKHTNLDADGTCRDCRVYNINNDPNSPEYSLLKRWQGRRSA